MSVEGLDQAEIYLRDDLHHVPISSSSSPFKPKTAILTFVNISKTITLSVIRPSASNIEPVLNAESALSPLKFRLLK